MLTSAIRGAGLTATLLAVGCGDGDFEGGSKPAAETGGAASFAAMKAGAATTGGAGGADGSGAAGGGSGGAAPLCVPGKSEACAGPAGCSGRQECKTDGSGFDECSCVGAGTGGSGAGGATPKSPVPPTFTGPDGKAWACSAWSSADNATHRCECSWYVPGDGHEWRCDVAGYRCDITSCAGLGDDYCYNPSGHDCICQDNVGTSGPVPSCP